MSFKISNQSSFKRGIFGVTGLVIIAATALMWQEHHASAQSADSQAGNVPVAGVAKVTRQDLAREVRISAEFRPYEQADLDAKVSGYVSRVTVDFGDQVKAGQLLATIEVPELQAQLANAQAVQQKAEADFTNSSLIYNRLVAVNKSHPNLVAQQELDTAEANDLAAAAAIAAAQAEVAKCRTLVSYTNITAPFDGVVTMRSVDPGQLVQAGTTGQGRAMLRVSDNYRLRLDFPVTVDYVKDIHVGDPVVVHVESLNDKTINGDIRRFTQEVEDSTRTMITEIEVPNPDLELKPGMYANVSLKVEKHAGVLAVPVEAVVGGKSPKVMVVNHDNQIEERPVTLGLETPDSYEVLSGLQEGDLVVMGNRAAFQPGQKVEPKLIQLSMRTGN